MTVANPSDGFADPAHIVAGALWFPSPLEGPHRPDARFTLEPWEDGWSVVDIHGEDAPLVERLEIAAEVDGRPVRHLGERALVAARGLRALVLPDSMIAIGARAACNLVMLDHVRFPARLESVGEAAFAGTALTEVELPSSCTRVGKAAFAQCRALEHVRLPSGLLELGEQALIGCVALEGVILPATCTQVGAAAFMGCTRLSWAVLPPLEEVPAHLFLECASLRAVDLPRSITYIGEQAFAYSGIETVVVSDRCRTVGPRAFKGCASLVRALLAPGVERLGDEAFAACTALPSLTLPPTLTQTGERTFAGCVNLKRLITQSAVEIGDGELIGCVSLVTRTSLDEEARDSYAGKGRAHG